jgi:predicted short-subunit dehydrogenase-like oxidoreductase (DUF2520 family)
MKVIIIGSGNVASVLGNRIQSVGHKVVQVISRSIENATVLASSLNADVSSNVFEIKPDADIYVIALTDQAIGNVAQQLKLGDKLVAHTAGSVSKDVLGCVSTNYGVLYPLQSLPKGLNKDVEIPIVIDGNSFKVIEKLRAFSASWASSTTTATDEQRLKLHVAAVVASNFTNHLYSLVNDFCIGEGLSFSSLYPMIEETAKRLRLASPQQLQTGPAVRGDAGTIAKHQQILKSHPKLLDIYNSITDSIVAYRSSTPG